MRPYFLYGYNILRFAVKRLRNKNVSIRGVCLMSRNARLLFSSTCRVEIEDRFINDGHVTMIVGDQGLLKICKAVYMNENAMISCKESVVIGSGCRFGPNVAIFDNDHCFSADKGVSDECSTAPIEVGEGSWIGANVVILKGTKIGKHCVIGAGCVVKGEIPDGSLVTQNRDLTIKQLR